LVASIPVIDRSGETGGLGNSHGAYAALVTGAFGQLTIRGQGECWWDRGAAPISLRTFYGAPVELLGEHVSVAVTLNVSLTRENRASYQGAAGGSVTDPEPVGDAVVLRATGIRVDTSSSPPPGTDAATYFSTIAGRTDTETLDILVAWRCDPAGPDPTPQPTATPFPTPACPPAVKALPGPIVPLLGRGPAAARGTLGTATVYSCSGIVSADAGWIEPPVGVRLRGSEPLTLRVDGDAVLFDASAQYAAAGTDGARGFPLASRQAASSDVYEIDAPPPGDWVLAAIIGVNDLRHGQVTHAAYYFRVTMLR
jgi:hypothetical protein